MVEGGGWGRGGESEGKHGRGAQGERQIIAQQKNAGQEGARPAARTPPPATCSSPPPPPLQATHLAENALGVLKHVKDGVDLLNGHALLGQVVKGLHNYAIGALAQHLFDLKARVVNVPARKLAPHTKRGLRHGVAARGD